VGLLLGATFLFFRPDWLVDRFAPEYVSAPAKDLYKEAEKVKTGGWIVVKTENENLEGKKIIKTVTIPMGEGKNARERIKSGGVTLTQLGDDIEIADVKFGSRAKKLGVDQGAKITELRLPNPARPSDFWSFIPAGLLALMVWALQGKAARRPT
jgi:hypothetical protein